MKQYSERGTVEKPWFGVKLLRSFISTPSQTPRVRPARPRHEEVGGRPNQRETDFGGLAPALGELGIVLNANPRNRKTLKQLSHFEGVFSRAGAKAMVDVPLPILRRAHQQLLPLAQTWNSRCLTSLAERMEQSIAERAPAQAQAAEGARAAVK